jgi:hypothetical protein
MYGSKAPLANAASATNHADAPVTDSHMDYWADSTHWLTLDENNNAMDEVINFTY